MTRYADFQPSPPYFITTSQIPASVQPGCVHVGNSVMTDTWQNLRFPHYGLRPQVLSLETLFTLSTSAFQVPKFCCCDLLFYTSQRCCFMAFEKQSHFYHCSRIWGGSGNVQISSGHLHPEVAKPSLSWKLIFHGGWRFSYAHWEQIPTSVFTCISLRAARAVKTGKVK